MQEFEKYPKLTEYIQEMANTGRTPREWTDFLYQLNQALRQPFFSGSLADAVGRNCPFCGEPCVECSHKATDR